MNRSELVRLRKRVLHKMLHSLTDKPDARSSSERVMKQLLEVKRLLKRLISKSRGHVNFICIYGNVREKTNK